MSPTYQPNIYVIYKREQNVAVRWLNNSKQEKKMVKLQMKYRLEDRKRESGDICLGENVNV